MYQSVAFLFTERRAKDIQHMNSYMYKNKLHKCYILDDMISETERILYDNTEVKNIIWSMTPNGI
jgi:hypothetical protein